MGSSPLTRGKPGGGRHLDLDPGLIPAHAGKTRGRRGCSLGAGAHPRSRGENRLDWPTFGPLWGSSPLTRGKRGPAAGWWVSSGLIPAHAGKTGEWPHLPRGCGAHPRSRGENATHPDEVMNALGSSPLTRGKRRASTWRSTSRGLIPAHAGKTTRPGRIGGAGGAHPRSRGENPTIMTTPELPEGSSPLTRGKPCGGQRERDTARLIPAHAGKTGGPAESGYAPRAHPRSRGENALHPGRYRLRVGSSPLTRGKPVEWDGGGVRVGLIPAHAGKTLPYGPLLAATWAHPRSRGENRRAAGDGGRIRGSSPLTRGKHLEISTFGGLCGLIPAHAGKTLPRLGTDTTSRAHPRSRGENVFLRAQEGNRRGSSPLTRGKRLQARAVDRRLGLIPAHAGKTSGCIGGM